MTKVLIIGSDSFIGNNFKKFSKYKGADEVSLIETSVENIEFRGYDIVLHLAAIVHQTHKISESEYFKVNRDLCIKVAESSKKAGIRHFIFMSTVRVYGNGKIPGIKNEYSKCLPDDAYGKSKLSAENGLKKLEDPGFIVSIIRTPLVYGEGVKANMISLIRLVDKVRILPFANVINRRNFTFAENLVGFIDRIIEKKTSGTFIAMDEKALSITELVSFISQSLGKKVYLFNLPPVIFKTCHYIMPSIIDRLFGSLEFDNSETKKVLSFNAPYSTEEGIRRTVSYFLKSGKQK